MYVFRLGNKLATAAMLFVTANQPISLAASPLKPAQNAPDAQATLVPAAVIDKSCLKMCDKWGPSDCLKWVTRCKGDPGYPKESKEGPPEGTNPKGKGGLNPVTSGGAKDSGGSNPSGGTL